MTKFDEIYRDVALKIINEGQMQEGDVRPRYADGTPAYTKYIHNVNVEIKPEDGFPILQSKRSAWKTAFKEIDWIARQMNNSVDDLEAMNVKVWSEWKLPDGSIGPSYGAQLRDRKTKVTTSSIWAYRDGQIVTDDIREMKLNQMEYVLHEIYNNPSSRRIMTTLYDFDDIEDMALVPCVWTSNWNVDDSDKLHLFVKQRSADIILGWNFNVSQYALLHRRIAQVTGYQLGSMYWTIDNAHIYDRHLEMAEQQVTADISHLETTEPKLILPESLDYFNTPLYEAEVVNYKHNGTYKYEIAI